MYITNHNMSRLIEKVELSDNEILKLPDIQSFISDQELTQLSRAKKFFQGAQTTSLSIIKEVSVPKDTFTKLYEGVPPAYHINQDCCRLQNHYQNLFIPKEVQAKGEAEVQRFRKYVKTFDFDELEQESTIIAIKAEFGFADERFAKEESNNSGATQIDFTKLLLSDIQNILNSSIQEMKNFSNISKIHEKVFQLRYRTPEDICRLTRKHNPQTSEAAKNLSELKHHLLLSKMALFQKEVNFNINNINEQLLKNNGFRACSTCIPKTSRQKIIFV